MKVNPRHFAENKVRCIDIRPKIGDFLSKQVPIKPDVIGIWFEDGL